ncbi:MAG: DUF333 domain-containing protein [Candidatus Micrarchaeota archaeon]|nr:DUF333 domain-containing protein [Candidatus Micrarchaeota archaeon]
MTKAIFVLLVAMAAMLIFAGCAGAPQPPIKQNNTTPPAPPPEKNTTGLANPASVNCVDAGYKSDIRGSTGYCIFPNERECEEWALFRGECTDADSFTMVETPGFVAHPWETQYKFYADGRLMLIDTNSSTGATTTLVAWLAPSDFASFVKMLSDKGYASLQPDYRTCGTEVGCPTDMPGIRLSLLRQGKTQDVFLYAPADHPANLDDIVISFKKIYGTSTFVQPDLSGCKLMKNSGGQLGCFGKVGGITNPIPSTAPAGYATVSDNGDGSLGSCTVDDVGGCAYLPPATGMTQKLCESARGNWNECASACRGAPEGTACTMQCIQECECGGIAGFGCPSGYFCTDLIPPADKGADGMGVCKILN